MHNNLKTCRYCFVMEESYSLTGFYRQDGVKGTLSGDVVAFSPCGSARRITGSMLDKNSPEKNRTLEGIAKREGQQVVLDFLVKVPGDVFLHIHYNARGNISNGSLAGTYQGAWEPARKEISFRVKEFYETCMTQEMAVVCDIDQIVPRKEDVRWQYAQITLTKTSEKKTTKKKKK
jgi:hypothetical protein